MRTIAIDTETEPIQPGLLAPRLVCASIAERGQPTRLVRWDDAPAALLPLFEAAARGACQIVGHNIAYDLVVLCASDARFIGPVFAALRAWSIVDTQIAAQMIDLFHGALEGKRGLSKYGLAALVASRGGPALDKGEDGWRKRYGLLRHIPLSDWPDRAIAYAKDDADHTLSIWLDLHEEARRLADDLLYNLPEQVCGAFSYQLVATYGMTTDLDEVARLEASWLLRMGRYHSELTRAGLIVKGVLKQGPAKELMIKAFGSAVPRTKTGQVALDATSCALSGDALLRTRALYVGTDKLVSTYLPVHKRGHIRPNFRTFLETGRVSSDANYLTMPKKGGLRECFRPRPGFSYVFADYDTAELRALGQAQLDLFGHSTMADVFQTPGTDPHTGLAATLMGIPVAKAYEMRRAGDKSLLRDVAKAINFALPGGMGVPRFISQMQERLVDDYLLTGVWSGEAPTVDQATEWRDAWHRQWPEMRPMLQFISRLTGPGGTARYQTPISRRYRGGLGYCDGANNLFQARTADGVKRAAFLVQEACLARPESPLYGSHLVIVVHDELGLEVPEGREHEAAEELVRLMKEGMSHFIPDVPIAAEPKAMRVWSKDAKSIYHQGRLQVWKP